MQVNNISLDVLVNGRPITSYFHNNEHFIEGREGTKYQLQIRNGYGQKVLVIPSVDGLSVIDGKAASYNSNGYLLDSYQNLVIDGWRISMSQVREFIFANSKNSYSAKSGQGKTNLGIIGLACYFEKQQWISAGPMTITNTPWSPDPIPYWGTPYAPHTARYGVASGSVNINNCIGGISASASSDRKMSEGQNYAYTESNSQPLGTGMGEKISSNVQQVEFDRQDAPFVVMEIRYMERKGLEKLGIIRPMTYEPKTRPQAFPMNFCKDIK